VADIIKKSNRNVFLACSAWKNKFNLEDTLFEGAVVHHVKNFFTFHCDSRLMAEEMYDAHKTAIKSFIRRTTHWHRLTAYGLEKDLEYCVTENVANVLPVYKNGALKI
jgi:2-phosphosulfolactate phosphatase